MAEHEQAKQQTEPGQLQETATQPREDELSDEQLDQVAGGSGGGAGKVSMQDFHFV